MSNRAKLSYEMTGNESGFYLEYDGELCRFTVIVYHSEALKSRFITVYDHSSGDEAAYTDMIGDDEKFTTLDVASAGIQVVIDFTNDPYIGVTVI